MKLKMSLFLCTCFFVGIAIVTLAVISSFYFTSSLESNIQNNLDVNTSHMMEDIGDEVNRHNQFMLNLIDPSNVVMHGDYFSIDEKISYLKNFDGHTNFIGYSIYDPSGKTLFHAFDNNEFNENMLELPENIIFKNDLFQHTLTGTSGFDTTPVYDEFLKINVLRFAGPLYDDSGNIGCILIAYYPFSKMNELIVEESELLDSTLNFELYSSPGNIIFPKIDTSKFQEHVSIHPDDHIFTNIEEFHTGWSGYTYVSKSEAFSEITSLQIIISIITGIILMIVFGFTFFISKRLAKPIMILNQSMKKFTKNEVEMKITPSGSDELMTLGNSFNIMMDSIKNQKNELLQLDKNKDEFTSMITHEIKNPLVPIIGYADMLLQGNSLGNLSEKQKNAIQIILNNSLILEKLTSDFLDVNKLELGKMNFDKCLVDNISIVDEIFIQFKPVLNNSNIELVKSIKNFKIVNLDQIRIHQIFSNLILNSIKYMDKENKKIEIGSYVKESEVIFYVKDNGTGLSQHNQKDLFKKFYQTDTSITRKHGGTGIGLSISKGIIDAHNGRIWCDSQIGKGTTMYFSIPFTDQTKLLVGNSFV